MSSAQIIEDQRLALDWRHGALDEIFDVEICGASALRRQLSIASVIGGQRR
jgi:hypothetical protein